MKIQPSHQVRFGANRAEMLNEITKQLSQRKIEEAGVAETLLNSLVGGKDFFAKSGELLPQGKKSLQNQAKSLNLPINISFENLINKIFTNMLTK